MPITKMVSETSYKENPEGVEVVEQFTGWNSQQVCHGMDCPHRDSDTVDLEMSPECLLSCKRRGPLYMRTTHIGLVVRAGEHNYRDDSDFFAIVWDEENEKPREVEYASTRGWTYPNSATVDATPEVIWKYYKYRAVKAYGLWLKARWEWCQQPDKDKIVLIIKKGHQYQDAKGRVFWTGPDKYKDTKIRVGITTNFGDVWCGGDDVEVVKPHEYKEEYPDRFNPANWFPPDITGQQKMELLQLLDSMS